MNFMKKLLTLLLTAIVISSCTSPAKKLSKAYDADPVAVAKFCHDKFPCLETANDTIVKTEYSYIQVKCDNDTITKSDTIVVAGKPKVYTVTKNKFIALPKEVTVITKYVKDSATIVYLSGELQKQTDARNKLFKKYERRVDWMHWLIIALAISLFLNLLFITNKK